MCVGHVERASPHERRDGSEDNFTFVDNSFISLALIALVACEINFKINNNVIHDDMNLCVSNPSQLTKVRGPITKMLNLKF